MEQQQKLEIGQRIKALRENSAETNRSIADYCGVSVEAVRNWMAGKGIAYDNAAKVAELFDRDVDYIWRGKQTNGDLMGPLTGAQKQAETPVPVADALDALRAEMGEKLDALHGELEEMKQLLASSGRGRKRSGS